MKHRTGFVSNSSSTSFTFCFKGDTLEDLYAMIKKYGVYFDLKYDASYGDKYLFYTCNPEEVIKSIKEAAAHPQYDFQTVDMVPIDDRIKALEESEKHYMEEMCNEENKSMHSFYNEMWIEAGTQKRMLQKAKERGSKSIVEIEFGDNHGHVCGPQVGTAMDYEGRYIRINKDDFVVFTEQHR